MILINESLTTVKDICEGELLCLERLEERKKK